MAIAYRRRQQTFLGLHVNCPIFSKFRFSWQIFVKVPNVKFKGDSASGSRADTCGRTDARYWQI